MKKKIGFEVLVHPFLFAIFPILFLYERNIAFFPLKTIYGPILKVVLFTSVLLILFYFVFKSYRESGVYVSLFLISFFLYHHFLNLALKVSFLERGILFLGDKRELFLYPGWLFVFIVVSTLLMRKKKMSQIVGSFTKVAVILTVIGIFNISLYFFKGGGALSKEIVLGEMEHKDSFQTVSHTPDIYYIILDGYARDDILSDIYGFEGNDFTDFLNEKGFFVAEDASSNYNQTFLSLSSSLNFDYIENVADILGNQSNDRTPIYETIYNSKVFSYFKKAGYSIVVVSSGYPGVQIESADLFITGGSNIEEFENALLNMTPVPGLMSIFKIPAIGSFEDQYRERLNNIYDRLGKLPDWEGPKFVFAHIMSPHPPFLFDDKGDPTTHKKALEFTDGSHLIGRDGISKEDYISFFGNQTKYVNHKMKSVVDLILTNSSNPPIIIIQGDHGPGSGLDWESLENTNLKERFYILNAYFFPGEGKNTLYPFITPVNSFRLILNNYFNTDYEILEDKSYFSTWSRPYFLIDVTDDLGVLQ